MTAAQSAVAPQCQNSCLAPDLLLHQLELAVPEGCCIQRVIHPADDSTMALTLSNMVCARGALFWCSPGCLRLQQYSSEKQAPGGSSALPLPGARLLVLPVCLRRQQHGLMSPDALSCSHTDTSTTPQLNDSQVQQVVGTVMDGVQQLHSLLCHLATVPLEQRISETCRQCPASHNGCCCVSLQRCWTSGAASKLGTSCWTALTLLRPT